MFRYLKKITYSLDGNEKEVANILSAFILRRVKIDNTLVLQSFVLNSGSTPESMAEEIYDEVEHYIPILLVNDVVNPYKQWYLDFAAIEEYTRKKYQNGVEGIHHFFDISKDRRCDEWDSANYLDDWNSNPSSLPAYIRPVTNLEFEVGENEAYREISVIHPRFISQFSDELENLLRYSTS